MSHDSATDSRRRPPPVGRLRPRRTVPASPPNDDGDGDASGSTSGRWAGPWPENGEFVVYDAERPTARVQSDGAVSPATAQPSGNSSIQSWT